MDYLRATLSDMKGHEETPEFDRGRIAALVQWSLDDAKEEQADLEARCLSHSTISKVMNGKYVSDSSLRELSRDGLFQPMDLLEAVGWGDLDHLEEMGADTKYVAWLRRRLTRSGPTRNSETG